MGVARQVSNPGFAYLNTHKLFRFLVDDKQALHTRLAIVLHESWIEFISSSRSACSMEEGDWSEQFSSHMKCIYVRGQDWSE